MGEAADRKVTEIEASRDRMTADFAELEDRLPSVVRSMKNATGVAAVGSLVLAAGAMLLKRRKARRRELDRRAEVVIRVVKDDTVVVEG